jgi:hypothetical protein
MEAAESSESQHTSTTPHNLASHSAVIFSLHYENLKSHKIMLITCYGQVMQRNHYGSMDFLVDGAQAL